MMRRIRSAVLVVLVLTIASVSASAQSWELSGFGGYTSSVALDRHAPELTDLNIRGGFTFGIQAARFMSPHWGIEAVFSQQSSALEAITPAGSAELYGIEIAQLHANLVYQFGDDAARLRPFVFGGAGATFFDALDLDSSTKASFGLGGGVKYFPWSTIGLRGHLKYKPAMLNDDAASDFCEPFGFCQGWLRPIELGAGVTIRF
jgi:hypothetical protein